MANLDAPTAQPSVERKAASLSDKMDKAVAQDNRGAYDASMREITEARSLMKPAQQQQFDEQLTKSLEFQTAALYDLKRNYSNIDTDGNSRLTKQELQAYASDKNTSPLQKLFIEHNILPNYDNIANISHDRWGSSLGIKDSEIRLKDLDQGLKNSDKMKHFYEKGADGAPSLYDRFKDKDGNLNGLKDAIKNPQQYGLSPKDVETLQYINEKRSNWSKLPGTDDMKAGDLKEIAQPLGAKPAPEAAPPANEAMKHFYETGKDGHPSLYDRFKDKDGNLNGIKDAIKNPQQYGLSEKDVESLKYIQEHRSNWSMLPGTNDMTAADLAKLPGKDGYTPEQRAQAAAAKANEKAPEKGAEKPTDKQGGKDAVPSDALVKAGTVRRGEGPYSSAERILGADGKHHSIEEVRALTKALQQLYKEEGHHDMKDLRVNHQFITKENFSKLIGMVHNDAAREALKKLAAA